MPTRIAVRYDSSGLNPLLAAARTYSRRTPAVATNTAGYVVALTALSLTPAADIARIDAALGVTTTPKLSTRGARRGLPLRSGAKNFHVTEGAMATRIVLARMWKFSPYNRMTGHYWYINRATFSPGQGTSGFWKKVELTAIRMTKGRHSSIAFIKSAWLEPIRELAPLASKSATRGRGVRPPSRSSHTPPDSGWAIAATEGEVATTEIANAIGTQGRNATLNRKHNLALHVYGGPPLQQAINIEARRTMEYIAREEARQSFSPLRSRGYVIDI